MDPEQQQQPRIDGFYQSAAWIDLLDRRQCTDQGKERRHQHADDRKNRQSLIAGPDPVGLAVQPPMHGQAGFKVDFDKADHRNADQEAEQQQMETRNNRLTGGARLLLDLNHSSFGPLTIRSASREKGPVARPS